MPSASGSRTPGFRFSLPKEVAKVLEKFRSHQWLDIHRMGV